MILSWYIQHSFDILLFLSGAFLGIIVQIWSHNPKVLRRLAIAILILAVATTAFNARAWLDDSEKARSTSCEHYGLVISSPKETDLLPELFQISGTYQVKPPEGRVVLFAVETGLKRYYPSGELNYKDIDKTWTAEFSMRGDSPQEVLAYVVLVGDSGRAMYDYYMKNASGDNPKWLAFDKLPPDSQICTDRLLKRM